MDKIRTYWASEAAKAPKKGLTLEKLFVLGISVFSLLFLYNYAKKAYNDAFIQGPEAVEQVNQGNRDAIGGIQDFKAD